MGLTNTIIDTSKICPLCGKEIWPKEKYKNVSEEEQFIHWSSKDLADRCNVWKLGERLTLTDGLLKFEATGDDIWSGCAKCHNCEEYFDALIFIRKGIIDEIRPVKMKCEKCGNKGGYFSVVRDDNDKQLIHFHCFKCEHCTEKKIEE